MCVQMVNSRMELNVLHAQTLAQSVKMQPLVKNAKLLMLCSILIVFQSAHQELSMIMETVEIAQITVVAVPTPLHVKYVPLLLFYSMVNA